MLIQYCDYFPLTWEIAAILYLLWDLTVTWHGYLNYDFCRFLELAQLLQNQEGTDDLVMVQYQVRSAVDSFLFSQSYLN